MKTHRSYSLFTITFSLVFAAALSGAAKTFDWPIDAPTAGARQFTAYHGETVRFNLRLGGAMTNLVPVCLYYQTNGMGKAEWFGPVPGTVFHPTNDCGAASYRFFILCNDPDGKDYTANGSLRLLDSPGFVPNEVPLPVQSLDFAKIEVLNPPWGEGPGNYAAVSNAAMSARDKADLAVYRKIGVGETWTLVGYGGAMTNSATGVFGDLAPDRWTFYVDGQIVAASDPATSYDYEVEWSGVQAIGTGGTAFRPCGLLHTGDSLATSNGLASVAQAGTNYTDRLEDSLKQGFVVVEQANNATYAGTAYEANTALGAFSLSDGSGNDRSGAAIISQLDAATEANAAQSSQLSQQSQSLSTLGSQVSAIGSYLNAEDARFVVTNYDSAVSTPEASVDVRLTESGTNKWMTIWREMTRWNKFTGLNFDWQSWTGFHAFRTNVTTELSYKADRAWGAYDSETGGYSPEGYTQISSPNILIAAGMAYQRTITTDGSVWVLQCNQGTAHIGGDTNGFFRVVDGDGVTQFEIIKGDRREMGADASGITVSAGNVITIPYSVEAAEHPTLSCCNNLATANWKDETDADCLCTVSWSGSSGAWVATVTPKTAQPSMFVKASYMAGGETYIRNVAPVGMDSIMLNGTKYYLGTATISGHTVLTLSTSPIVQ